MPTTAVAVLAAGAGSRVGADRNKVLLPLRGRPLFTWSLAAAGAMQPRPMLVLVVAERDREAVAPYVDPDVHLVTGGPDRHASEWRALQALAPEIDAGAVDLVVIHDAARPLAPTGLFEAVVARARELGGAIPGRLQQDLLPRAPGGHGPSAPVVPTPPTVLAVQTPQAFRAQPLLAAFRAADQEGFVGTDTASTLERYTDLAVGYVDSPATNLKVTFPEDIDLAARLAE